MSKLRSLFVCSLLAVSLLAHGAARTVRSSWRFDNGAASSQLWMTTADFTGDGKPDVLVSTRHDAGPNTSWSVRVSPSLGNGSFAAVVVTDTQRWRAIGAADFNGDARADVYALGAEGKVAILFNNGDGSFGQPANVPADIVADGLVAADFNGDGRADLAMLSASQDRIVIAAGSGSGGFASHTTYSAVLAPAQKIVPGDFDHDGRLDFVLFDPGIVVAWNDGISFSTLAYATTRITDGAVGDVNGDGTTDFVATGPDGATMAFGSASRALAPQKLPGITGDGTFNLSVTIGNFDGDNRADLVFGARVLTTLTHDGTNFRTPHLFSTGDIARGIVSADFDGDGKLDVAGLPGFTNGSFWTVRGDGNGLLHTDVAFELERAVNRFGGITQDTYIADVNGDGELDLITMAARVNELAVLFGHGDGTFDAPVFTTIPTTENARLHDATDLNGDGRIDLVLWDWQSVPGQMTFWGLFSQTNGTFTVGPQQTSSKKPGNNLYLAAIADFTGDATLDLLDNSGVLHPGLGNGMFGAPVDLHLEFSAGHLSAADINGDHKLDLAILGQSSEMFVYLNNGGGTFAAPLRYFSDGTTVTAIDVNKDGFADLAGAESFGIGRGDGTFDYRFRAYIIGPLAGDFDGDGNVDLANNAAIFFGTGTGVFDAAIEFGSYLSLRSTADLNHDGRSDLWLMDRGILTVIRTVDEPPPLPTHIELTSAETSVPFNRPQEFFARLTGDAAVPRGSVLFRRDGAEPYALAGFVFDRTARDGVFNLPIGTTFTTTATYTGDALHQPATSQPLAITITKGAVHATLIATRPVIPYGEASTVNARFDRNSTGPLLTGTITILRNGTPVKTVNASSLVQLNTSDTSLFPAGKHTFTAQYSGDATWAPATTPAVTIEITRTNSAPRRRAARH